MGNTPSCAPSIISSTPSVKILVPTTTNHIKTYTKPVKTADLMLEHPNHFVCDSTQLVVGQRIEGLLPEQTLRPRRQLYFLLPMEMLYSVLTQEELGCIADRANRALRHFNNGYNQFRKIFPVCIFPNSDGKVNARKIQTHSEDQVGDVLVVEKSCLKQRSWRPALDTIVEGSGWGNN